MSLKAYEEAREIKVKEIEQAKKNASNVTTLQMHNGLIPFMVYILNIRQHLYSGRSTSLPSVSFTPSGRFANLSMNIISKISSGLENGVVVNEKEINTEVNKEFLSNLTNDYAKVFFGYNIEDLDFEVLSPIAYNKTTDILIPKIDPFFFIKEVTTLDGTEFSSVYDRMYKDSNHNKNLLDHLNSETNAQKDVVDNTMTNLGVTYRRLREIDYKPLEVQSLGGGLLGAMGKWGVS